MTKLENFISSWDQEYRQMRLGLDRMQSILAALDHPEKNYACILVAGTNGKGSVSHMLESVLRHAGYRVGLATSPHLQKFNERICINGIAAQDDLLEKVIEDFENRKLLRDNSLYSPSGEKLTWFEKVSALTLEAFRQAKVEIAILEIGMGGRLDANNAVEPILSIITSVDLDHTEVLGNSVFEIAKEKSGVMRPKKPVVLGYMPEEVRNFLNIAARITKAIPIRPFQAKGSPEAFFYRDYQGFKLGLSGQHQLHNAASTIEAIFALREQGFNISDTVIKEGLATVSIPGRLELISQSPAILLDVAHNVQAIQALIAFLQKKYSDKKITFLLGMLKEKNAREILKLLKPLASHWVITTLDSARSFDHTDWEKLITFEDIAINAEICTDTETALKKALATTQKEDLLVVTGSFYLVGKIRETLIQRITHV